MSYFKTKYRDYLYIIFRIGVGALFLMLSVMKLFGLWGMPSPAAFGTLIWYAGIFELMIGMSMLTGILVRLASFFGIIMMIVAYTIGHALPNKSWNPLINMGMPAILFMLAFIATLTYGAGKSSLEKAFFKKEFF